MAPGETYARLDEYQAAKRVLTDCLPLPSASTAPRTIRLSGPGSTAGG